MANIMTLFVCFSSIIFYVNFVTSSHPIIKLDNGQTFKCVHFHKQPAFRNSPVDLQVLSNLSKLQSQKNVSELGLGSRRCSIGTVPVLHHSKKIVVNPKALDPPVTPPLHAKRHCVAQLQTSVQSTQFFGIAASITVYKLNVPQNQWSTSRIQLSNGIDSIEAGWSVNPSYFGDQESYLYGSFSTNGRGCINLACSGFVQVSTELPLGLRANSYSNVNKQVGWDLSIDKHQDDGNWWLTIGANRHQIGYWPKSLFSSLQETANQYAFGGEIDNPGVVDPPTPMGNSLKASYDTSLSSVLSHATVVLQNNARVEPTNTQKFADCPGLYTILDGGAKANFGRLIFYGGPGPDA